MHWLRSTALDNPVRKVLTFSSDPFSNTCTDLMGVYSQSVCTDFASAATTARDSVAMLLLLLATHPFSHKYAESVLRNTRVRKKYQSRDEGGKGALG